MLLSSEITTKKNGPPRGAGRSWGFSKEIQDEFLERPLSDLPEGVFRPKLLFLELLELQLLARRETQPAIERGDALRELSMLLFETRLLSLRRDDSSVVLGHVTSKVLTGFAS